MTCTGLCQVLRRSTRTISGQPRCSLYTIICFRRACKSRQRLRSLRDIVLPRTTEDRAKGTTTVAFNDCRRGQGMEGSRGSARTWARLAQESDFYSDTTCGADASSTTLLRARTTGPAAGGASALRRRIAAIEERALGTPISTCESGRITRCSKRTPSSQPNSAEPSCSLAALRSRATAPTTRNACARPRRLALGCRSSTTFPGHQPISRPNVFAKWRL